MRIRHYKNSCYVSIYLGFTVRKLATTLRSYLITLLLLFINLNKKESYKIFIPDKKQHKNLYIAYVNYIYHCKSGSKNFWQLGKIQDCFKFKFKATLYTFFLFLEKYILVLYSLLIYPKKTYLLCTMCISLYIIYIEYQKPIN